MPQVLSLCPKPWAPQLLSPCEQLLKPACPSARAAQEKPPQREACTPRLESSPCSPQLERSLSSSEDPAQPNQPTSHVVDAVLRFGEQPPFATLGAFSISVGSCGSLPSQDGPKTSLQACLHPLPSLLQGVDGFCSFFLFPSHRCLFLPWWLRW